jgi:hypothetical protein
MSLEKRLEKLEEQLRSGEGPGGGTSPREWEQLFHAQENARRELHGLEPLPDLPYTEEDRENDLDTLQRVIPTYRASAGWQSEEVQTKLDAWEEQLKQRIGRNQ